MDAANVELSRISKLFVDRDQTSVEEALYRRQRHAVSLVCGADVGRSYVLQIAVLTALVLANRCFPGAVRVVLPRALADAPLLVWPVLGLSFAQMLVQLAGASAVIAAQPSTEGHTLVFGDAPTAAGALRVTFDGWIAKAGPVATVERLRERQYCSLSGVLAAALAVAEVFFSFADISIQAGRRAVALSLWRPDLDAGDAEAVGIPVQFLPCDMWMLGLGHLGNAFLWSVATMPYANANCVEIFLNDFDRVAKENFDTGLLFYPDNLGQMKTRVCAEWLEDRGFRTRLVERPFDQYFRCRKDEPREPRLAFCGFDSNPARRHLVTGDFLRVVESGLGGTAANFDTISLHTLPNPRAAEELWPDVDEADRRKEDAHRTRLASENPAYLALGIDPCGRYNLAGHSVAVPFVGAAASALVVAEVLRLLHGGPSYSTFKIGLASLGGRTRLPGGKYVAQDLADVKYCDAQSCE